jgi:conjugative transfer signal peptidase TraF
MRRRPQLGRRAFALVAGISFAAAAVAGAHRLGLGINWTSSAPRGIYRQRAGPIARRALVLVCLPPELDHFGRSRGYLPAGICASGSSPILKQVVALARDEVELQDHSLAVNGSVIDRSEIHDVDSLGRHLGHAPFGSQVLASGEMWLLGLHRERSWDSRYFGPVPVASIVAIARPLMTLSRGDPE